MRDGRSHAAARRGKCHFHLDASAAFIVLDQTAIVNQTKINNIDWNFRVIALAKLVPDVFLRDFAVCCVDWLLGWLRLGLFKTQSVEIFLRDSSQPLIRRNRIAATKALRDHSLSSSRNGRRLPTRDLDRLAIATQCEFSVLVHGFRLFVIPSEVEESLDTWREQAVSPLGTLNLLYHK
jgi:hypothetical protein